MSRSATLPLPDPVLAAVAGDRAIFIVEEDGAGHCRVRETHGLVGGEFVSRHDAIRFARDESAAIPGSIIVVGPAAMPLHPVFGR